MEILKYANEGGMVVMSHLESPRSLSPILKPLGFGHGQRSHEVSYAREALGVEGVGGQAVHLQVVEAVPGGIRGGT